MGAGPGSAEVGPAPVWRATPRARAETLRAAPETVSGTGQQHGGVAGWGVGCGEWGQQAGGGGSSGGQGPTPRGSRRPTITPSLRKIAPRRAAQPLNIRILRGGVGAGPHDRAPQAKIDPKWQKMTRIFRFFGVFWAYFFRQRHCRTIQRYGGLREGLRGSLVAWARGVKGLARGGHQPPRPPR